MEQFPKFAGGGLALLLQASEDFEFSVRKVQLL